MDLSRIVVRPVSSIEDAEFQRLMQTHHYLGALPKISNTIRYFALVDSATVALVVFSASALKCGARDRWIGWGQRFQYGRLHLIANNSRFAILPGFHHKNLASKVLSLCKKRIQRDWEEKFGFKVLLLETFVDPSRFVGTIYKASNWRFVGETKGYKKTRDGYTPNTYTSKMVFVQPLQKNTRAVLSADTLPKQYLTGAPRMKLAAEHMWSLPAFFQTVDDPRRAQGRKHPVCVVLSITAAAILCGMDSYKAISDWTNALSQKARERFRCRIYNGKRVVPSLGTIRDVLIRVRPTDLDKALQKWNEKYGAIDSSLAIDGKTMCNAIDEEGRQTHIMSAVGHQSKQCYTQKKSEICR